MNKTVVIDIVGLSVGLIGEHTPFLKKYIAERHLTLIEPVLPAVTTTAQSCYVTGKWPSEHGIVGNGWYDRDDAEIKFWKQSNHLVQSEKIWELAKREDPTFTWRVSPDTGETQMNGMGVLHLEVKKHQKMLFL